MNGILDHAPLATRVAWVRDLFERIDVDSRDEKAVAVWRAATDEGVSRSDSVYEWLRRAGAGRVLNRLGTAESEIAIPLPSRSREWLKVALVECQRCHQVEQRRSPIQRHCAGCTAELRRQRSQRAMARRRDRPSSGG
jgi:hypothetical protein